MAWIGLFMANFALISLAIPWMVGDCVFATDLPRRLARFDDRTSARKQTCNFNEPTRSYNATELVLCMNELASVILQDRNINSNRITDRAYQDSRQSYLPYQDYSMFGGASSNYFDDDMLMSLLSGALPLSGLTNLFSGFTRPGFNLFRALSSIAQYDDLKCVPRILCEVASGSMPGSINYKQSSGFQDFGQNALFRLLTAFDVNGSSSPILTFGRAALLGYTNRGHPGMCYHEYPRCPHRQDQLISYLNNHKGGFFRLFGGDQGSYYRPQHSQQSPYRPYYKNPGNELEYRIVGSDKDNPSSQYYQKLEDDRTGTGKLSFSNSNVYKQDSSNANFFPAKLRDSDSSKIIFPKEDRQSHYQPNRVIKSLNGFNDYAENQRETLRQDRQFFPQDDNNRHSEQLNEANYNRKPRFEQLGNSESLVFFPHDTIQKDTSIFVIPNSYRNY